MLTHSLFILYSTPNYEKLTSLCLKSLKDLGVKNVSHYLDELKNKNFTQEGFQTDLWYYCLESKIKYIIKVLNKMKNSSKYKYYIFSDCDIIYYKYNINEWNTLKNFIDNNDNDIFFMRENTSNDINSGFYIIKNNKNIYQIINFFIEVLNILSNSNKKDIPHGDQTIINNLKSTINFDYIPNDYMIWGKNIHNINKSLLHHCVCVGDIRGKLKQISQIYKKMKKYFLMKTR